MRSCVAVAFVLVLCFCAPRSFAAPGDPLGGDEPGCYPLSADAKKCQDAVAKAASKALGCILRCHIKRADGKLADDTAEEACENSDPVKSCKAKYDKATGPGSKIDSHCPPCLTAAARANVYATIENQLDNATNAAIYCAAGTAFGGDDQGNVPTAKSDEQKCEDAVAKAIGKASTCILACGIKLAGGKLADDTAEDACESGPSKSCKVKYDGATAATSKIDGLCPACLDATARGNLFTGAETQLDVLGGVVYCCEPTTTTTSTSTTTTTTCPPGPPASPMVLKGSLTATPGRFNYNLQIGLPAANNACNTNFAGTHACSYQELQAAAAACDLPSLQDTSNATVTSFWAIDPNAPVLSQCFDDATFDPNTQPGHNWEYGTAHTGTRGNWVALDNTTGALGPLQMGLQCNSAQKWVGCCQ